MNTSSSTMGSVPRSAAMAGSDVAITVASMFSMNRAEAIMSGSRRAGATISIIHRMTNYSISRNAARLGKLMR